MKLTITSISFLFLLLSGSQSKIEWVTNTTHDFGEIKQGVPVFYDFKFKNTDEESVIIETARSTCGCTIPDWTKTPISPDSLGVLKIEYDAKRTGYFKKKIMVFVSGQRKSEKIYIEGDVVE